jgi:dihydroorotate dehydrogenase electron transfer subunit
MGSEVPFPFALTTDRASRRRHAGSGERRITLLEEWGVPSRLASGVAQRNCYRGFVTDLARTWLATLDERSRAEVAIYACGPTAMLAATARLAREFALPCQVALEELMACATGGCAGCAVRVQTPEGPAMKKVCVEGPVFDAALVF